MSDEQIEESKNPLEYSDDEFESMSFDEYAESQADETDSEEDEATDTPQEGEEDTLETGSEDDVASEDLDEDDEDEDATEDEDTKTGSSDFEKRILAPFKANGKDMQVANADEAVQLMQMGANYTKKMAGLKPSLRIVRMLENNGLLDEGKINNLIDLSKKNPKAIAQLFKDSGIDPLDIDSDGDSDYEPTNHSVSDSELRLQEVLSDIRSTPEYSRTIEIVGTRWDESSRTALLKEPDTIRIINDHVAHGVFDQISNIVESEQMLGRLTGMSDYEAYKSAATMLLERNQKSAGTKPTASEPTKVQSDPNLKARKRASGIPRSKPAAKLNPEFNPLNLSDEEFEKLASSM